MPVFAALVALAACSASSSAADLHPRARTDAKSIEQVWVPPGSFRMGTTSEEAATLLALDPPAFVRGEIPSEQPAHDVRIGRGFWIDRTEVTNAAFQAFVDADGYAKKRFWSAEGWRWLAARPGHRACADEAARGAGRLLPCTRVTWYEADAYARWRGGRLPTEAEWEYAARGPSSPVYPWGDAFDPAKANVVGSDGPVAVGSFPAGASWVGALDMAGNAMEWVADWLDPRYYESGVAVDPAGPATGRVKIEKGGWWGSNPFVARAAYRHFEDPPDYGDKHIGLRIVTPAR